MEQDIISRIWEPELEREFLEQMKPLHLERLILGNDRYEETMREHEAFVAKWTAIKEANPTAYWAAIREWGLAAGRAFAARHAD